MLKDDTRVLLEQWDAAHPDAMYLERIAEEMRILRDRSQWNLTALGRYERPKIDPPLTDPRFDEVVLVTDGANVARAASDPVSEPQTGWHGSAPMRRKCDRRAAATAMWRCCTCALRRRSGR